LSGYLAGKLADEQAIELPTVLPSPGGSGLRVFYASQTGNGEIIADQLVQQAMQAGIPASVQSLNELRRGALKKIERAAFIISTHGEGDPPDDALDLFEFLQSTRAPRLDSLEFRVLALGDSTYSQFCEAGRKLEEMLLACGAQAFAQRIDCDLDYEEAASQWSSEVIEYGRENMLPPEEINAPTPVSGSHSARLNVVPIKSQWSRKHPFPAIVEKVQKITAAGSDKDVYHIELSLENSGMCYEPGDSLGVWAFNDAMVVAEILDRLRIDPQAEVNANGSLICISDLLLKQRELTRLSPDMVSAYATHTIQTLQQRLDRFTREERKSFIEHRQFIDLVTEFPSVLDAQELADLLRPLSPRSYSIASSQASVDEEVHLTVATLRSNGIGIERRGMASSYLNSHLQVGDEAGVFLEPNHRFHLPADRSAPLILVAAGTGIAPYRAFLQQLEEEGAGPDTWLIFGNPRLRTDFLYQREWLDWRSKGLLSRIDCAFSRDQAEKRYVQHIIAKHAAGLVAWLDRGAHVYICGAQAMGSEVELALQASIGQQTGISAEAATGVVSNLRRERRLLKDLY
jgi:sulfite reductase (NADPH) flavoprotein alpha-component